MKKISYSFISFLGSILLLIIENTVDTFGLFLPFIDQIMSCRWQYAFNIVMYINCNYVAHIYRLIHNDKGILSFDLSFFVIFFFFFFTF